MAELLVWYVHSSFLTKILSTQLIVLITFAPSTQKWNEIDVALTKQTFSIAMFFKTWKIFIDPA
jgi:hypothetical protein